MRILHLHLKFEYFDAIRSETKTEEYREFDTWKDKLIDEKGNPIIFDQIKLYRGYPKSDDEGSHMLREFYGWKVIDLTHPHFGPDEVKVFAIDVTKKLKQT